MDKIYNLVSNMSYSNIIVKIKCKKDHIFTNLLIQQPILFSLTLQNLIPKKSLG